MTCCTPPMHRSAALHPVSAEALPAVAAALAAAGLPTEDLTEPGRRFFAWRNADGTLLGYGGIERHGGAVLLRSILVLPEARGHGHGRQLTEALLAEAWVGGAEEAWLLTTSAAHFFLSLGFVAAPREAAPSGIAASRQFAGLCPASATLMRRPRSDAGPRHGIPG